MSREFSHIRDNPIRGDVIEILETIESDGSTFDHENMLRVIAVHEDHVWFKQYGDGRHVMHINSWRQRLAKAKVGKVVRPGDIDIPF